MYNVKLVHEKLAEVHKQKRKPLVLEKIREREHYRGLVKTIVTPQRVEKLLYKLVDEGVVPKDFTMADIKQSAIPYHPLCTMIVSRSNRRLLSRSRTSANTPVH